ncbi:serine/threonine protein kinase, partial [filamentous cyanobacterium CCP1]
MIGHLIDRRYLITQRLSSGGFGETFLAQDTRFPGNPLCVVKQLKPASNNPKHIEKAQQLFNREAEALAQLGSYEQIPRLLAYFTEGDDFYLVQEFIEGHTLEAELQPEQRWLEEQVIQLLKEVLTILVYVHAHGVIHRDIKPANIMRRQQDSSLVLIDFGAIKQVRIQPDGSGEFSLAAPGTRIGTVGYMPTEQARGKPRPCSDLYALGMIAIQALTGLHPTQLEDDSQTGEVRWQHLVNADPRLMDVLNRMTRYQFRDRFQSAAEALQALEQALQQTPPTPAPLPIPDPTLIPELIHEMTLQWVEGGQAHSQVIYPNQPSCHLGSIRIGRDPTRCDIVLSDITVSGLHVEIFFNAQDRSFYVRNLRETNPPLVNG